MLFKSLTTLLLACLAFAVTAQTGGTPDHCSAAKKRGPSMAAPQACSGFVDAPDLHRDTPFPACFDACAAREGGSWRDHYNTCMAACNSHWEVWRAQRDQWEASPSARRAYLCSKDDKVRFNADCPGTEANKAPRTGVTNQLLTFAPDPKKELEAQAAARLQVDRNDAKVRAAEEQQVAKKNAERQLVAFDRELKDRKQCALPQNQGSCNCGKYQAQPPGGRKTCDK